MQASYALLPAISYPKTVGGMCYAKIRAHNNRVKISINNQPIRGWETKQHGIVGMLFQHAVAQS